MSEPGRLYVVGTPIGNLEDITYRAARILSEVEVVAAEDTRHSLKLLNHLGLSKPLVSYHEHNRRMAGEKLLAQLLAGQKVALVTDAGMPVVSDPGAELVALARGAGIAVEVIPGPCAVSTALAASGFDGSAYVFFGFLPRKGKERAQVLRQLAAETRTAVLYEAPHRIRETLQELSESMPDRMCVVCNDLTKFYERVDRMELAQAAELYGGIEAKGEFAVVLEGAVQRMPDYEGLSVEEHLLLHMRAGLSKKEAIKQVALERGVPRSEIYACSVKMQ